jgi:hypothetical protein
MALVRASAALLAALVVIAPRDPAAAMVQSPERPSEYAVKAAFMYNFVKFVDWPSASAHREHFVVAVVGEDPFGPLLDQTFAGKKVQDRALLVKRVARPEDAGEADLLFVSSSEAARLPQILSRFEGTPTLTVGEMDNFITRGGMVGFRLEEDVVRFDINLDRVGQARLKMSSQLIRVARKVIATKGGT